MPTAGRNCSSTTCASSGHTTRRTNVRPASRRFSFAVNPASTRRLVSSRRVLAGFTANENLLEAGRTFVRRVVWPEDAHVVDEQFLPAVGIQQAKRIGNIGE